MKKFAYLIVVVLALTAAPVHAQTANPAPCATCKTPAVPEPSSLIQFGVGLLALAGSLIIARKRILNHD